MEELAQIVFDRLVVAAQPRCHGRMTNRFTETGIRTADDGVRCLIVRQQVGKMIDALFYLLGGD